MVWSPFYLPEKGGIETLLADLLPRLTTRGHDVLVLASRGRAVAPEQETVDGVSVVRLPMKEALQENRLADVLDLTRRVASLRKEFQPHVIHIHGLQPGNFFHLRTARVTAAPTLLTLHNDYFASGLRGSLVRGMVDQATRITAVSPATLVSLLKEFPDAAHRASVIVNGIDPGQRRGEPVGFEPPRFLLLGRLIPAKGGHLAIEAFRAVAEAHPGAQLIFAGIGYLQGELRAQAERLGLAGSVSFLGEVPRGQVSGLLESATALLMPSRVEGLPMVLLAASARECPVIATRVGGIPEIIEDGVTGRLVPPDDPRALERALLETMRDRTRALEMAAAARQRAETLFNIDEVARRYEAVYGELAEN